MRVVCANRVRLRCVFVESACRKRAECVQICFADGTQSACGMCWPCVLSGKSRCNLRFESESDYGNSISRTDGLRVWRVRSVRSRWKKPVQSSAWERIGLWKFNLADGWFARVDCASRAFAVANRGFLIGNRGGVLEIGGARKRVGRTF